MDDPNTEYLLGAPDDDSPPSGVVQLRYRHSIWTAADDAWLEDVFVTEEARRSGLGRALVLGAIDRAEQRNCRRIELDVDDVNEAAHALYQDLGFAEKHGGSALMVKAL
jgi:GNAT superfamily N-acetyltransferase